MSRLEKKCFLASAATHGLLVGLFLLGSAFFTPPRGKLDDLGPVLTFTRLTDLPINTGGYPNVQPAPAPATTPPPAPAPAVVPPQPAAPPPPKAERTPEPPRAKEAARPREDDRPGLDPTRVKPTTSSRISTNLVKRSSAELAAARAQREAQERAQRELASRNQRIQSAAAALGNVVSRLGNNLSGPTVSAVEAFGPGGGVAVSNWRAAVAALFEMAWTPPPEVDGSATVKVSVTIARDGTVLSSRILSSSGDRALDRSVERVLREVTHVPPFPEGATDDRRTLTINFNHKSKQGLG